MGIGNRLLNAILNVLFAIFNIPIRSKYVVLVLILSVTGSIWYTRHSMLENVGGKEEYNEAMRYIELCESKRLLAFSANKETLEKLSQLTEAYLCAQLERGFSTLDFYKSLLI